jgi:hypothetical protein
LVLYDDEKLNAHTFNFVATNVGDGNATANQTDKACKNRITIPSGGSD